MRKQSIDRQTKRSGRHEQLGDDEKAPAIHSICVRSAPECEQQQRHELRGAQHTDQKAGVCDGEYLIWHCDVRDHASEHRNELACVQKPVVAVFAQRREA